MKSVRVHGQDCFVVEGADVSVAVTRLGGHMAPVTFFSSSDRPIEPYHISPWQTESVPIDVPVLRPLRGDFFCLPFGANAEPLTPHGESATEPWAPEGIVSDGRVVTMALRVDTQHPVGTVEKEISLIDGDSAVYVRHTITGNHGRTSLGHHATLGVHNGPLSIATSPIRFGYTNPYGSSVSADGEYYSLASGARFSTLKEVPTIWKEPARTDCTVFPAREGFVDILQVCQEPGDDPGWVTAVCAESGYLWYALKDTAVLPSTVFWMENRGRHASPWNGRNACIGLEDVCGLFAEGLPASAQPNLLTEHGVATCHTLPGNAPFVVSYIEGAVRIPDGFDAVASVRFTDGHATFVSRSGIDVTTSVRHDFVRGSTL